MKDSSPTRHPPDKLNPGSMAPFDINFLGDPLGIAK
jgi:hypothetical protein